MMRTRRWAPVLGLTMVVTAACGAFGGGSEGDTVTLTFWTHTHPPMVELNKELIAEYEAKHPGVEIEYQQIPNTEFATKMLTSLSGGTGPDIINMDDTALRGEYIAKDLVAPIDPQAFGAGSAEELVERFMPGSLAGAQDSDGELYGMPSEFNATAFAINKAHFADAGLDPEDPPETWDEVGDYGEQLTAAGHEGFNFLYLHSGWYTQQLQTLLNQTDGSILSDDGQTCALTDPESVEALEIWNDLIRVRNVGDPDTASREATVPFVDFASGRRSMTMIYPWAVPQLATENPETFKNLEVVPLPQADPSEPSGRWYAYYWAVNQASEQQAEAWKFIAYLSSQHERWLRDVNFIQPVKGWEASKAAAEIPFLDVWAQAYTQGEFDEVGPYWIEVQDAIKQAVEQTIFDGVPPADSLASACESIDQSLGG